MYIEDISLPISQSESDRLYPQILKTCPVLPAVMSIQMLAGGIDLPDLDDGNQVEAYGELCRAAQPPIYPGGKFWLDYEEQRNWLQIYRAQVASYHHDALCKDLSLPPSQVIGKWHPGVVKIDYKEHDRWGDRAVQTIVGPELDFLMGIGYKINKFHLLLAEAPARWDVPGDDSIGLYIEGDNYERGLSRLNVKIGPKLSKQEYEDSQAWLLNLLKTG